jgi:carbamoyltransferase
MDYLVIENCLLSKSDQSAWEETENWREEFELD